MNIVNILKADLERVNEPENYRGAVLRLGQQFGAKALGFHVEVIDPKNFSCPYHYHTQEEELFLVLEGEAIVRRNNEFRKVGPGDLIFYEVGAQTAHNMYNHTDKPFKILALSNNGENDICHYPDSKKVSSEQGYLLNGVPVPYFTNEEDPSQYWPAHALKGEI